MKKCLLTETLLKLLYKDIDDISSVYYCLFAILQKDTLEYQLKIMKETKEGKENWFYNFYKTL